MFEWMPGFGWIPDTPDLRDYHYADVVNGDLRQAMNPSLGDGGNPTLVPKVDLRQYCPPIKQQGTLGSCSAHAAAGVVEYMEQMANGKYIPASRLFIYKVTRNLMGLKGDTGASLRAAMGTLALFGAPPEKFREYTPEAFDVEPSAFMYAMGGNYKAIQYYRLDQVGLTKPQVLDSIKASLSAKIPVMFGFTVYSSYTQGNISGVIPFPTSRETVAGGHAIVAVGYDDNAVLTNKIDGSKKNGCFIIRNSWGTGWGDHGYGYLPYEYLLRGLAVDWWGVTKQNWIDSGVFV